MSVSFKLSCLFYCLFLFSCSEQPLNNPYPQPADKKLTILYSSFSERPRYLDPAKAYSTNEYAFIGQIYEPPFQYHFLKRPYQLEPLTAKKMPEIYYYNDKGERLDSNASAKDTAYSDYIIQLKKNIYFQPHPALAKGLQGDYLYHQLLGSELEDLQTLQHFKQTGTRELIAADYVHQIKRLVHPQISSPIAGLMKQYIVGLTEYADEIKNQPRSVLTANDILGVKVLDKYRYSIRIKGKNPQFIFWLAMPFFAPMPWEADVFYSQQGLIDKDITLDWHPLGTGPYMLEEHNPNLKMVMSKNPNYHDDFYPQEGEKADKENGLLKDAGKQLPFIDKIIYHIEKESIPYWTKFLQGYYDTSGIVSDSFDQAIHVTGEGDFSLTDNMQKKGIQLQTAVMSSISYMGFNMLDSTVGGKTEKARKLRLAIALAIDYEEYISIFMNGRGIIAQGIIPPGIFGYQDNEKGINPYLYLWEKGAAKKKSLLEAQQLMQDAGYTKGIDKKTGKALILHIDTAANGANDRARLNWYRKQFTKLGIQLVIRATDYNRFQQKMRQGNAQMFMWGWNADYPDPENFFFLLYGQNAKAIMGGENAGNYQNAEFDRLFNEMSNMPNNDQRQKIIQRMQEIIRHDSPWVFGVHPKSFLLYHQWYQNLKPNLMANNKLKYFRIDVAKRNLARKQWNQAVWWPFVILIIILAVMIFPVVSSFQRKEKRTIR
jgi:ABC-type transport system substrate-binding protein